MSDEVVQATEYPKAQPILTWKMLWRDGKQYGAAFVLSDLPVKDYEGFPALDPNQSEMIGGIIGKQIELTIRTLLKGEKIP